MRLQRAGACGRGGGSGPRSCAPVVAARAGAAACSSSGSGGGTTSTGNSNAGSGAGGISSRRTAAAASRSRTNRSNRSRARTRARRSGVRILREQLADDRLEDRIDDQRRDPDAHRRGVVHRVRARDVDTVALERQLAGEQLVADQAEREQIDAMIELRAHRLLGRHVVRRADDALQVVSRVYARCRRSPCLRARSRRRSRRSAGSRGRSDRARRSRSRV